MPRTTSLSRRRLLAAGTGLAAGLATGCGAGAGGAPDLDAAAEVPTGDVTLDWWSFRMATADGGDVRETLVRAFSRRHPNIRVNLVEAPANTDITRTTLSTAVASGAPSPDLYMGDVAWPAQFAYNALALPLGSLLPGAFWEGFPDALVRALSFEDEPYAFPFYIDQSYLYYRADLLDKHGLAVPRTWEEVARAATAVRRAGDADMGLVLQGAVYEGLTANVAELVADAGGTVLDPTGGRVTLGGAAGERAFGFLQDALADGVVPAAVATFKEQDSTDAFTGGRAVFLRNWAYVWGVVEGAGSPVAGRVGVMPRPGFDGGGPGGHGCLGGWCNFVNPHAAQPGAAVAFARFCAGEEAQMIIVRDTAYLPALSAARASDEARGSRTPTLALAGEVRLVARPTQSPRYPQVSKALYTRANTVLSGGASAADALAGARADMAAALRGESL
ncbi:extracellular solute-binding protein [Streptomyces sp. NPDC049879]|uniref:extracellular solute-binding protein n=1 Tax=Streptomyces sp. NPDC049879 TaxID=3365598 RepID=UPI00378BE4FE